MANNRGNHLQLACLVRVCACACMCAWAGWLGGFGTPSICRFRRSIVFFPFCIRLDELVELDEFN